MTDEEYILGRGNRYFTLQHRGNGTRFTYNVRRGFQVIPNKRTADFIVSVCWGGDEVRSRTRIGKIHQGHFKTRKNTPGARTFTLCWEVLTLTHTLPPGWRLHRSGRCGRCGRMLTDPASIAAGIGPVCATLS